MELPGCPGLRRSKGDFSSTDQRTVNRDGKEDVRVAHRIVVEEIRRPRLESVGVDRPASNRRGQADLVFLIAFAVQGNETQILRRHETEEWTRGRDQWRPLVIAAGKAPDDPVDPWELD